MKNILHFEILSLTLTVKNVDNYLEQFNKYKKLCKLIKKTKANIIKIGNFF